MSYHEAVVTFECQGTRLFGVAALPDQAAATGVVIVVGGPQYRVGSHRQFVLLARALADAGHACLRFDVRGMGDSQGEAPGFASLDADIEAAITALQTACPAVRRVVLWGLCDGASAAVLYVRRQQDARVVGLALANPWLASEQGQARAIVHQYYWQRLVDPAFWRKLLGGRLNPWRAACEFGRNWQRARTAEPAPASEAYQAQMLAVLAVPPCPVLLLLCQRDATAQVFLQQLSLANNPCLQQPQVQRADFVDADHTFSRAVWRGELAAVTIDWLNTRVQHGNAHA